MRRVIRLGDPHTHGGNVITAAPNTEINGKRVARRGDKAVCPKKGHGVVTIVEGDPSWSVEGHKCSCGCALISTLPTLGRSYEGAGAGAGGVMSSVAGSPAPKEEKATGTSAVGATNDSPIVVTGLGDDVDKLVAMSPSLQKDLQQLDKEKWTIEYGPVGGGSTVDRDKKIISIDGAEKGCPAAATQSLAHEVGHATYPNMPDYSSKSAYVDGALADEGAATMNNIKVQREILSKGARTSRLPGTAPIMPRTIQRTTGFSKTVMRPLRGRRLGKNSVWVK